MRSRLEILQDLHIASPCTASWDEMEGDERQRFCRHCEKHVYHLGHMDPHEAVDLIEATEGNLCVRLYLRHDGTALTEDCPIGVLARVRAARRWAWARASAFAALLAGGLSWYAQDRNPGPGGPDAPTGDRASTKNFAIPVMGEPAPLRPAEDRTHFPSQPHPDREPIMGRISSDPR